MTIQATQLSMGYSRASGSPPSAKPTCSSCALRFVTTEPRDGWPAGSLECTKGGFRTQPLARCNAHTPGDARTRDPAASRSRP